MAVRKRYLLVSLTILALGAGCAQPKHEESQAEVPTVKAVQFESDDLRVTLEAVIGIEQERSLVRNPGWLEYVLAIENLGGADLTIQNVKLLNHNGRYVNSASDYKQITTAPDVSSQLAGIAGRKAAGSAAGSLIPYGGTIVSAISSGIAAYDAEEESDARQIFALRALKNVELAPNRQVNGSAFLPKVEGANALVIRYLIADEVESMKLALPAGIQDSE